MSGELEFDEFLEDLGMEEYKAHDDSGLGFDVDHGDYYATDSNADRLYEDQYLGNSLGRSHRLFFVRASGLNDGY